jgi:hypothetical protein
MTINRGRHPQRTRGQDIEEIGNPSRRSGTWQAALLQFEGLAVEHRRVANRDSVQRNYECVDLSESTLSASFAEGEIAVMQTHRSGFALEPEDAECWCLAPSSDEGQSGPLRLA